MRPMRRLGEIVFTTFRSSTRLSCRHHEHHVTCTKLQSLTTKPDPQCASNLLGFWSSTGVTISRVVLHRRHLGKRPTPPRIAEQAASGLANPPFVSCNTHTVGP